MKLRSIATSGQGILLLGAAVLCLNIVSSRMHTRLDATQDKLYSLSQGSRTIAGGLNADIQVRLYFSRSVRELPYVFKTYASRVEEVLNDYAAYSKGRLTVEVIDPKPDTSDEEWAIKYRMVGNQLPTGDRLFFGAVFLAGAREEVIPFFDPRREELLEYDISETLVRLGTKERTKLAVLSSLPMNSPHVDPQGGDEGGNEWSVLSVLKRTFDVSVLSPDSSTIDPAVKVLLVVHPKDFPEATLYTIDQFVMRGGHVIMAVDPLSRLDLARSAGMGQQNRMPNASSDAKVLLQAWGVEYDPANVVGDLTFATQINAGGTPLLYPYFLSLREGAFSRSAVVTSQINQMMIGEGGALAQKKDSPHKFEALLETSAKSGTAPGYFAAMAGPEAFAGQLKMDDQKRALAALVTGKFSSAFPNGRPASADGKADANAAPHIANAAADTSVLIIADSDFLTDDNSVRRMRFFNQVMLQPMNDNLSFVQNAAEYLAGSQELISIRSRGRIARPFDRVLSIQADAQQRWKKEEDQLSQRLNELQSKLGEMQAARADQSNFTMSPEQQSEIEKFRQEEVQVRRKRREVRKNLREDIERLSRHLIAANMVLVPLGICGFGFAVFRRRAERMRSTRRHGQ